MSIMQRRKSARLASTIDALTNDLEPKEVQTSVEESMSPDDYWGGKVKGDDAIQCLGGQDDQLDDDMQKSSGAFDDQVTIKADELEDELDDDMQKSSGAFDDQVTIKADELEDEFDDDMQKSSGAFDDYQGCDQFDAAFDEAMDTDEEASIFEGDPGVKDFGSEATKDTDSVRGLGKSYGVDFDGDDRLEPSIRKIPGRTEKQAKIKRLISRIENVANICERRGRKALAYRLDIVCNYLESKYFNK